MFLSAESTSVFPGGSYYYKLHPVDSYETFNISIPPGVGAGNRSGS